MNRARYPDETGYVERDGVRVFWERYGEGDPAVLPAAADMDDHPLALLESADPLPRPALLRAELRSPGQLAIQQAEEPGGIRRT